MKIAIVGSRNLKKLDISKYIPKNITMIISGGAKGIDTLAERYADENGIKKMIFLPDYEKYGKSAPLMRNKLIVQNADLIVAIWDGISRGTKFTIDFAEENGKQVKVFILAKILP